MIIFTTMPTKKDFIEYFEGFYVPTDFFEGYICEKILPDVEKYKKYKDPEVDVEVRKHLFWSEMPLIKKMEFIKKMTTTFNKFIEMKTLENADIEETLDTNKRLMFELLDLFSEIEDEEVIAQLNPKMKDILDKYIEPAN